MKRYLLALLALMPTCVFAQVTPNLQLNLPPESSSGWAQKINQNFTMIDQYLSGGMTLVQLKLTGPITSPTQAATKAYVDAAVIGGCGICITSITGDVTATGSGASAATVKGINGVILTSLGNGIYKFASGVPSLAVPGTDYLLPSNNLSDLTSASSARTNLGLGTAATQATSAFDAAGAAAAAQSAAEAFAANASNITSGTIGASRVPILNQNTTGNAATATALAVTPTLCSAGQAAGGILPSGNATQCFTPSGGGGGMIYPGAGIPNSTGSAWGTSFTVGNTGSDIPQLSSGLLSSSIIPTLNQSTTGNAATATALASTPSLCSTGQYAKGIAANGTPNCGTLPTGTVTTVSTGNLSPLFTAAIANPGTTPALSFTQSTAAANSIFGNFTGSSAAPTFSNAPVFSAANLTNFPTFNQNTTGTATNVSGSYAPNFVYASPDGSAGSLTPRALVAADIPMLNYQVPLTLTTSGTSGAATLTGGVLNIPQYAGGGSMVYPSGSGIPVVVSGTSWGTTVAAPGGTIVGTSDTQTLTNKSIAASQLTGTSFPNSFTTAGGLTTVAGGTFGTAAFTSLSAYDASGSAATAQANAEAAFTGDVVKTSGSFATTVTRINGTSLAGLATGLLKNTITTGIPSIAVAGTDYQAPISLTTTGTGVATLTGAMLNIPNTTYTLPTASTSVLGGVKVDGTSITISGGVISSTSGGSGTVTSFSSGNLSPLFTTSVATATSTPAVTYSLSTAAANTVFGNFTGSMAAPTFTAAPTFSAANLTSFPTFNQNTTGYAAGIAGGAVGSIDYQSAANTTAFLASPTTTGHTFVPAWQPSGSAIAPTSLDLAAYLASPPSIGSVTPGAGAFTTLTTSGSIATGSGATACGAATGIWCANEASTAGTPTAGQDYIRADSTTHSLRASVNGGTEFSLGSGGSGSPAGSSGQIQYNNSGSFGGFTASGDATITPSTGAVVVTKTNGTAFSGYATATYVANVTTTVGTQTINANSCGSEVDLTMTGFGTGMTAQFTPNSDVSSVTGWGPSGGQLYFSAWAKAANTVAYKLCNATAANITIASSTTWNVSAR